MSELITGQLATTLQAALLHAGSGQYADQPAAGLHWDRGDQFATGLRPIQPDVRRHCHQHLVSSHGTSNGSTQYAVTLTGSGSSWQVSDIELASAGNS